METREARAMAQLALARLLLREAAGVELPGRQGATGRKGAAGAAAAAAERVTGGAAGKERRGAGKEGRAGRGGTVGASKENQRSSGGGGGDTQKGAQAPPCAAKGKAAPPRSYAAAAAAGAAAAQAASRAAAREASAAAAPALAGVAGAGVAYAHMAAAVAVGLAARLQELTASSRNEEARAAMEDAVNEALAALSAAREGFAVCGQPAGALEALSWTIAAKPLDSLGLLPSKGAGSEVAEIIELMTRLDEARDMLKAIDLEQWVLLTGGRRAPPPPPRGGGPELTPLSGEYQRLLVAGLEHYYCVSPLHNTARAPVEVREDGCCQVIEALACISQNPREMLSKGGAGGLKAGLLVLSQPQAAGTALAAHVFAHAACAAARCLRAAAGRLVEGEWLGAWAAAAGGGGGEGGRERGWGVSEAGVEAAQLRHKEVSGLCGFVFNIFAIFVAY